MPDIATRRSTPNAPKLDDDAILALLTQVPGWLLVEEGTALQRTFKFKDYWHTMAFVNAVAWIAHTEDHHPDLTVHYNTVGVRWNTHSAGGVTENDFICAAKVSGLVG